MLNKAILVVVIILLILAVVQLTNHKNDNQGNSVAIVAPLASGNSFATGGGEINAQVSTWNGNSWQSNALTNPSANLTNLNSSQIKIGQVWQRDPTQYSSNSQFAAWNPSACSAASLASVLAAFGHKVTIGDLIPLMQNQGGFSPVSGLSNYTMFSTVAQHYGLHAVLDESKDVDSHFAAIITQLQAHQLVIINVQDPTYFPNGHFIVAYGLNADGTVAIMNSDPGSSGKVLQSWSLEGLKLYFSRTLRSIAFTS